MVPTVLGWWLLDRESVARPWSLMARGEHAAYPIPIALLCRRTRIRGHRVAYMLQYDVVRAAGAVVSTTVTYLIPVVSILLGVLVLGSISPLRRSAASSSCWPPPGSSTGPRATA